MRDADTRADGRIPKDDWCVREVVKQPHAGAQQRGSQIDMDFVEQPSVQALLDRFGAVHSHGLRSDS